MKGVVISMCIAVVMVVSSIAYSSHMKKVSEELVGINDNIMVCLMKEDYEGAKDELGSLIEYIERNRTMLAAIGDHEEFDKIEMNIAEMAGYINGQEKTDAMSRCRVMDFLFEHLPKNYEMKLENVL